MKEYGEMELNILSCLLIKPELMEKIMLEDKYFIQYKRMWIFMKAFYNKYKTLDIQLMYSVCKNRKDYMFYLETVINVDALPCNFELYQKRLKEMFEEKQKDSWVINKIFDLTNDLYVRNINLDQFKEKLDIIFVNADKIFTKN